MTYRTDRLRALAGLVRLISKASGMVNITGLWRATLPFDLLWAPRICQGAHRTSAIAQSWSWASVDDGVESLLTAFKATYRGDDAEHKMGVVHVKIGTMYTGSSPSDEELSFDAFEQAGKFRTIRLSVQGTLKSVKLDEISWKPDHEGSSLAAEAMALLIYSEDSTTESCSMQWAGLILNLVSDIGDPVSVYERIGSVVAESPIAWMNDGWKTRDITLI
jgi:hypothetical protein